MELTTELVIKIVVLLTAMVGLYKVAVSRPRESEGGPANDSPALTALHLFFFQLVTAASVFIIPITVLAMLWLFTNLSSFISNGGDDATIDKNSSATDVMYAITKEIWDTQLRQQALQKTIDAALEEGNYVVLIQAINDLRPTTVHDEQWMKAINRIASEKGQPVPQ